MSNQDFDLNAGNSEFYVDPIYYDYEFKNRTDDVAFYTAKYLEANSPLLELAIGSGRTALKAVSKGADVIGVDLAPAMLARAQDQYDKMRSNKRGRLELHQGDMRTVRLETQFQLVTCPFNAFQHMYTLDDAEKCLETVKAHLAPDGVFIMDVLTPDFEYLMRSPYKAVPGVSFRHPTYKAYYTYSERSAYDPITQLNQMWFHYEKCNQTGDGPTDVTIQLSHRYFYPEELMMLLRYNGFRVLERFGDFTGGALDAESDSMVLICKRASD
ncbi:MAG: hypothetical protein CMH52_03610 [Myxococcales bacterium]|nr:hypothetical protein [Myxococcales bacterium]